MKKNLFLLLIIFLAFGFWLIKPVEVFAETEILRPIGSGVCIYECPKRVPSDSASWQEVVDDDDDGTYIYNNTLSEDCSQGGKGVYFYLSSYTGEGTINWVKVHVRAKRWNVYSSYIKTFVATHSEGYFSGQISLTTSYDNYFTQYNNNPYTGSVWTWQEIGDLRAGFLLPCWSIGTDVAYCTKFYVEVNYTPAGPAGPAVATDKATISSTQLQNNQATLKGTLVNRGGASSCDVRFEYRKPGETGYPHYTSWQTKSADNVSFSADISLIPQTVAGNTYYYRAVADCTAAGGGTAQGTDKQVVIYTAAGGQLSFTTPGAGASGTLSCSSSTQTSITLSYSFSNGTNVSLFRGSTKLTTFSGSSGSGNYFDSGLSSDTSYNYYLKNGTSTSSPLLDSATCTTLAEACTRANPIVSISPSSQSGNPGQTLSYTATIINYDSSDCGNSTFNLTKSCPSGWSCSLSSSSITISPNGFAGSVSLSVTSPTTASAGNYTVKVRATNSSATSYWGEGSAIYTVIGELPSVCEGTGTLVTFYPIKDAYIRENNPDNNFGTEATMIVRTGDAADARSLVGFDTSSLDDSAEINCVRLSLKVYLRSDDGAEPPQNIQAHKITGSWGETVTWNTQPSFNSVATDKRAEGSAGTWVVYDLTGSVNVAGESGWLLKYKTEGVSGWRWLRFYTRESSYDPKLEVFYTGGEASGSLSCYSSTENSITLSYSFSNGTNVSLFRGSTRLTTFGGSSGSGNYTNSDLSSGTSYTYYLRNGTSASSPLLDSATCSTGASVFNFGLTVNPSSGEVAQGDLISPYVRAELLSGESQLVSFSASISPSEPTISIDSPASCNLTCVRYMTIITSPTTPIRTYTITVAGTSGGLTRYAYYSLTVLPLECSGNVSLTLTPSTVAPSGSVIPSASGLSPGCEGKTIYFRKDSCSGTLISSCTVSGGGCIGSAFTAPTTPAIYTYYACIDKNNDGDYYDSGEYDSKTLNVTAVTCAPAGACSNSGEYCCAGGKLYICQQSSETDTFYSTPSDGCIWTTSGYGYEYVHHVYDGHTGDTTRAWINVGQQRTGSYPNYYWYLWRVGLFFDTSSLSDDANITAATLSLYGSYDYSSRDFYVTVVSGADLDDPLVPADYYPDLYNATESRGRIYTSYTSGFNFSGYNDITLNSIGLNEISKTGTTKFGLRSSRDINYEEPSYKELIQVYANEKGSGYQPKLSVTYTTPRVWEYVEDCSYGCCGVNDNPCDPCLPPQNCKCCPLFDTTSPSTQIKIIRTSTGEDVTTAGYWLRADNYTIQFEDKDQAEGSGLNCENCTCEYSIHACDVGGTNCTTPIESLTTRNRNWSFPITAGTSPYDLEGLGRYRIYSGATDNADNSGTDYKYLNFDFTPPETRIE